MKLGRLIKGFLKYDLNGDPELEIKGLSYDSRRITPGYLFVAIKGHNQNGHDYVQDAIKNGAVALIAEDFKGPLGDISKIKVPDSREALSRLATRFYENPCRTMDIIGITGTNGKTTTSYLLESMISATGARPGVIGTINYRFSGKTVPAQVTTPESLDLMRLMREMADEGVTHVVMEVSSHALDQRRTLGCPFRAAIFTNFSRDHLDYHNTMEEYFQAKSLLFRGLKKGGPDEKSVAIINADDPKGEELVALTRADVVTYGLGLKSQVKADFISLDKTGLRARLVTPKGKREIQSSLLGRINIYNILAATATAISLDMDLDAVVEGIERLKVIPGRLELVQNRRGLTVVVDYAHTPDALQKALETLGPLTEGRLITVFGCGGDRDKGKRDKMGLVAGQQSDIAFITSDNPRTEDPESIVAQIEKGVQQSGMTKEKWTNGAEVAGPGYCIEVDRRRAIQKAIAIADEKDLVLIAGKGHEDYQIIGTEKRHFDDRKEVALATN
ncbi:MAG: UDP-N-acetylmuramoyl-L-alanyl-D-glutamate--2,6-diaminopimelate ligase [Deltaproteobacteria bacterium]|nr:UDP-N-acetylmuramoyl-L-alanyl-D-glutamate--2,6-diaminopimelate ligase [Deltaproteobacteria bacterium]